MDYESLKSLLWLSVLAAGVAVHVGYALLLLNGLARCLVPRLWRRWWRTWRLEHWRGPLVVGLGVAVGITLGMLLPAPCHQPVTLQIKPLDWRFALPFGFGVGSMLALLRIE